jgi:hypothetical protein
MLQIFPGNLEILLLLFQLVRTGHVDCNDVYCSSIRTCARDCAETDLKDLAKFRDYVKTQTGHVFGGGLEGTSLPLNGPES